MADDPKLYQALNTPVSFDQANENLKAFYALVEKARALCKIPDVVVLAEVCVEDTSGDSTRRSSSLFLGAFAYRLPMVAREYGRQREVHEEMIAVMIKEGRAQGRSP